MDIKVNDTKQIPYSELENGMIVWLQGIRFKASNVTKTLLENSRGTDLVVRFTGSILSCPELVNTAYDGGQYGGFGWVKVTVEI